MSIKENMIRNSHVFYYVRMEANEVILHDEVCNDSS